MRRSLIAALAVPVLLLAACGSDDEPSVEEPSAAETSEETAEEPTEDAAAETAEEPTEDAAAETAEQTEEPSEADAEDVEGGEEGAAAAAVTEEFMVAMANADPAICDLMLDAFSGGDAPMSETPANLEQCQELIVPSLEGVITEEQAQIIELIEVSGADVQDDSATVDKDNFSELFAEGFGDEAIELKKIDGEWYIDLENSFQAATATAEP